MKNNGKVSLIGLIMVTLIVCIVIFNTKSYMLKGMYAGGEIEYDGQNAITCYFYSDFTEAEYLGFTEDRSFEVYTYRGGAKNNLFTLIGSDNTYSYKTDSYIIPTSGDVTKVFIDPTIGSIKDKVSINQTDIEMFKKLVLYKSEESSYHINNIYTEGSEIYFAYNNCPAATVDNLVGYITYINDSWIIVSPEDYQNRNTEANSHEADLIGNKIIHSKIIEWLNLKSAEKLLPSYTEKDK